MPEGDRNTMEEKKNYKLVHFRNDELVQKHFNYEPQTELYVNICELG